MAEDDNNASLAVVRGALQAQNGSEGVALPASRVLALTELSRIDAEEGVNAALSDELGTGTRPHHAAGKVLVMLCGVAVVLLIVVAILPMNHFFRPKLTRSALPFAESVGDSSAMRSVLGGLSQPERVLAEAKELAGARRYSDAAETCRRALEGLGADRAVHHSWAKVWAVYFDTLLALGHRAEMKNGLRTLTNVDPDLDVAVYYRGRYWLDEIETQVGLTPPTAEQRKLYAPTLSSLEKSCRVRAEGKNDVSNHFGLLLADLALTRWVVEGSKTDEDGLALFSSVIDRLKMLPETVDRVNLELKAWEKYLRVAHSWHSWKLFERRICGEVVNRGWVESRIAELRKRLGSLGAR